MSIDLAKLTPSPWHSGHNDMPDPEFIVCESSNGSAAVGWFRRADDAGLCALARRVLDIQMRRGWTAHRQEDGRFFVDGEDHGNGGYDANDWNTGTFQKWCDRNTFADPFTAIDEAEKFYVSIGQVAS